MAIRIDTITHPLPESMQISWTNDTTAPCLSLLNHKTGIITPPRAQSCNKYMITENSACAHTCWVTSVTSNPVHGATRLLCPWDSPGKNDNNWNELPCPSPGDLPDPGTEK